MADEPVINIDIDGLWQQAMALPAVEAAAYQRAANIASRARQIAARDGVKDFDVKIERHYMINGRMSFNVVTEHDSEFGKENVRAVRALRRASREVKR